MEHLDVTPEQGYELILRAVDLAKQARTLYLEEYQDYVQSSMYNCWIVFYFSYHLRTCQLSQLTLYLYWYFKVIKNAIQ